jgi:hypothetical protein
MLNEAQALDLGTLTDAQLTDAAWRGGFLRWKLSEKQQGVYDEMKAQLWGDGGYLRPSGPQRRFIVKCCRRFGKTFINGVIAVELCMTLPHARVYWAAETAKQVKNMIAPNLRAILEDCPADLRPKYNAQDGVWAFPNGAEIHAAGCEDESRADRLRGDGADLFILDEAGHITPLKYVYTSIALWMTAARMGRIVMPSSPAKSPGHAFTEYSILAESGEGGYAHRTVYQSDLTPQDIRELMRECGGEETVAWQREGMARDVVDQDRAIVPEFALLADELVGVVERPRYVTPLTWMDVGFHPDFTAVLFAYWNREIGAVVIEDELQIGQMTTDQLASALAEREHATWGEYWARLKAEGSIEDDEGEPYQRISDISPQLLHDLSELHGLPFMPVHKATGTGERGFVEATVNKLRMLVRDRQIRINPRCKNLIAHLKAGVWNKARSGWERIDGYGHFDFIDALRYGVHHLDRQHDPSPAFLPEEQGEKKFMAPHHREQRLIERDGDIGGLDSLLSGDW